MINYISLKQIMSNLLDHPLLRDLSYERVINYTLLFLLILQVPVTFIEKIDVIEVKDYRGKLPCDFYKMIQVREKCGEVFRASTDSFHYSKEGYKGADKTYKIQGNFIFTNIKKGDIEIAYQAIAVDEDGYPLVPDNAAFINALELYIKYKHFTILSDLGKIPPLTLLNTLQEYTWAVGQAQASMIMPSIDEMQAITNSINTLVPRMTLHKQGFVNNGTLEYIKVK